MTRGEGYAQRQLQQSDYYDQNRSVEGHWHGRGAELLGLKGKVTSEDFEAPRQGFSARVSRTSTATSLSVGARPRSRVNS